VLVQTFRNPNGAAALGIGNNFWEATLESGLTAPIKPGEGVGGLVSSGMVEDANVELTQELVQMIIQQRNYQANAQIHQDAGPGPADPGEPALILNPA
jgi:flagellar hook protein FlgE